MNLYLAYIIDRTDDGAIRAMQSGVFDSLELAQSHLSEGRDLEFAKQDGPGVAIERPLVYRAIHDKTQYHAEADGLTFVIYPIVLNGWAV